MTFEGTPWGAEIPQGIGHTRASGISEMPPPEAAPPIAGWEELAGLRAAAERADSRSGYVSCEPGGTGRAVQPESAARRAPGIGPSRGAPRRDFTRGLAA